MKLLRESNSENEFDEATLEQETAEDSVQVNSSLTLPSFVTFFDKVRMFSEAKMPSINK